MHTHNPGKFWLGPSEKNTSSAVWSAVSVSERYCNHGTETRAQAEQRHLQLVRGNSLAPAISRVR